MGLVRRVYRYREDRYLVTYLPDSSPPELVKLPPSAAPDTWFPWKRHNNIIRAQSMIQALGFCNDWDFFVTLTLDPSKSHDRNDLDLFRSRLTSFFRKLRFESGCACRFLLVPELHKSGSGWHMHGLLSDFPDSCFRPFSLFENLPDYILGRLAKGDQLFDFPRYRENFGYVVVDPLRSRDHAVSYLTKYVVKGLNATGTRIDKGKHLYFASRGLSRPELMEESDQYSSSPVLDEVESRLQPTWDSDISYEVDGEVRTLGFKIWYEAPSDDYSPSEFSHIYNSSSSLSSLRSPDVD